ncbi:MAG: restriction endonuclease subunit S [Methanothrix sp.]|nr:restriction endonuclease subunit S [Methanothrix sp.]
MIKLCKAEGVPSAQLGLHGTFPMQGDLRPNPNWARLPLFDRKDWTQVQFGDVVQNVNETERSPAEAGIERFIGMEHLEPGSLHVRAWGDVADGTTFTRRCRPGQVLFGKQRAYQRKVAVAEFKAVVSGDIYVFAPKDERLLPELLPFLCMSERFFQYAVETSAGSLSPRTNWGSLASFEFDLPPLDRQRRIAEMLWAVDWVEQSYNTLFVSVKNAYFSKVDDFFFAEGENKDHIMFKPGWKTVQLQQVVPPDAPIRYGIVQVGSFCDHGVPTVVIKNLGGEFGDQLHRTAPEIEARYSGSRVRSGDLLLSIKATVGEVDLVPENFEGNISRDLARIRCGPDLDSRVLLHLFRSDRFRAYIDKHVVGSTRKEISIHLLRKFEVPLPTKCESDEFLHAVALFETVIEAARTGVQRISRLRNMLINRFIEVEL